MFLGAKQKHIFSRGKTSKTWVHSKCIWKQVSLFCPGLNRFHCCGKGLASNRSFYFYDRACDDLHTDYNKIHQVLPIAQVSPPNPEVQEHRKWPTRLGSSPQLPPFLHGFGSQGLATNRKKI